MMQGIKTEHLQIYPLKDRTEEWVEFRVRGIGGSEVASLCGIPSAIMYHSPAKIYNEKIGRTKPWTELNEAIDMGIEMESIIRRNWEYYNKEGYTANKQKGLKQRDCGIIDGYIVNPKYPWLFASVDGFIYPGEYGIDGEQHEKGGILEIKTVENTASQNWKGDYPLAYEYQIQHYLLVCELDYAEIAILKNGRYLSVFPIYRNEEITNEILRKTHAFWHQRVVHGTKSLTIAKQSLKNGNEATYEEHIGIVDHLEPEPDGGQSYEEMLAERYESTDRQEPGDVKNYNRAIIVNAISEAQKQLEATKKKIKQFIKKDMKGIQKLTYTDGYISHKQSKDGSLRLLTNVGNTDEEKINNLVSGLLTEL